MRGCPRSTEISDLTTHLIEVKIQLGCAIDWDSRLRGKRRSTIGGDQERTTTVHTPKTEAPLKVGDAMKVAGVPDIEAIGIHAMTGAIQAQANRIMTVITRTLGGPARGVLPQSDPHTLCVLAQMRVTMLVAVAVTARASATTVVGRKTRVTSNLLPSKPKRYLYGP